MSEFARRAFWSSVSIQLAVLSLGVSQEPLVADDHVLLQVTTPDAPVRSRPNRLSEPLVTLDTGNTIEATSAQPHADYYRVRLADGDGYIHESYVLPQLEAGADATDRLRSGPLALSGAAEPSVNRHLKVGQPESVHVRHREGYSVGVDSRLRIPVWVQYELNASELNGPGDRDDSSFKEDASIPPPARALLADYRGSGFDRGHMAPAGDMKRNQKVMDESFLLSNIGPQIGAGFNRDIWALLEGAIRDWTRERDTLTVITGPVFGSEGGTVRYRVVGESEVAVPTGFFKIVVDLERKQSLAFEMPNERLFGHEFHEFLVSIDDLEARTGLDFLADLSDADQRELESEAATQVWGIGEDLRLFAERVGRDVQHSMIDFDEEGNFVERARLDQLAEEIRAARPTHLFLLAHGWNNSRRDAIDSYRAIMAVMGAAADANSEVRPVEYRPFVVGVYWPSKAWDNEGRARLSSTDELTGDIVEALPPVTSAAEYRDDVRALRELLGTPESEITEDDRQRTWDILQKYSLDPQTPEDESIFDIESETAAEHRTARDTTARMSIGDIFRVFTFWQMKKRAGEVGGSGGRRLIARLMREAPDAQVHLGGHSFGTKFWLSAVGSDVPTLPRRVKSLALVQGAVSAWAFADQVPGANRAGGYRSVLSRVDGPIVATYSSQDWPLRFAYPAGSRLAGQTGELERAVREPGRYSALGATGAGRVGRRMTFQEALAAPLSPGLSSVDAGNVIGGHSDFYNESVARLLWAAISSH